ncbi:hypothetical protein M2169_002822 [Streptomyces sp. MJP52]|nr:hypothetical protein [Streptomyces sp. MJP52]
MHRAGGAAHRRGAGEGVAGGEDRAVGVDDLHRVVGVQPGRVLRGAFHRDLDGDLAGPGLGDQPGVVGQAAAQDLDHRQARQGQGDGDDDRGAQRGTGAHRREPAPRHGVPPSRSSR